MRASKTTVFAGVAAFSFSRGRRRERKREREWPPRGNRHAGAIKTCKRYNVHARLGGADKIQFRIRRICEYYASSCRALSLHRALSRLFILLPCWQFFLSFRWNARRLTAGPMQSVPRALTINATDTRWHIAENARARIVFPSKGRNGSCRSRSRL